MHFLLEVYKTWTETLTYSEAQDVLFSVIRLIMNADFLSSPTKKFALYGRMLFLSEDIEKTVRFLPELVSRNASSAFSKTRI